MPCNDWSNNNVKEVVVFSNDPKTAAILCAAFKYIEKHSSVNAFLLHTKWEEQGVSQHAARKWWEDHKKKDEARKARERKAELLRKKKEEAMKKLTAEERKILGL